MAPPAEQDPPEFLSRTFRADAIRGRAGHEIDHRFAHAFGRAVGDRAARYDYRAVVVGRDARLSSVELAAALQAGIRASGMGVVDIGMMPTPLAWFAARLVETGAAVAVTGGHDDEGINGFKLMLDGAILGGKLLRGLRTDMQRLDPHPNVPYGPHANLDAARCYAARLACDVHLARSIRVALDCGNGVARTLAANVLREAGCDVLELPEDATRGSAAGGRRDQARQLLDLAAYLRHTDCELGLWLGGDGDRLGVASRSGAVIGADRLLILLAQSILPRRRGPRVLHDAASSRLLPQEIRRLGGLPVMCHGGEVRMAAQMRASGAVLAGEMNGCIRFKDRWNGHSDGLYAAMRLLEILSRVDDAAQALDALPQAYATPELRLELGGADPHALIETLRAEGHFVGAREVINVEGIRVEYGDGFGLARPAPSGLALLLRFEADDAAGLSRIQEDFRRQLLRISRKLQLPF